MHSKVADFGDAGHCANFRNDRTKCVLFMYLGVVILVFQEVNTYSANFSFLSAHSQPSGLQDPYGQPQTKQTGKDEAQDAEDGEAVYQGASVGHNYEG